MSLRYYTRDSLENNNNFNNHFYVNLVKVIYQAASLQASRGSVFIEGEGKDETLAFRNKIGFCNLYKASLK